MMNEHKKKKWSASHIRNIFIWLHHTPMAYVWQRSSKIKFLLLLFVNEWVFFRCCWINWLNPHFRNVLHVSMVVHVISEFFLAHALCTNVYHWCLCHSTLLADIVILIFNIFFFFVCGGRSYIFFLFWQFNIQRVRGSHFSRIYLALVRFTSNNNKWFWCKASLTMEFETATTTINSSAGWMVLDLIGIFCIDTQFIC